MNNEIYEKNIRAIKKRWPDYLELLNHSENKYSLSVEVRDYDGQCVPVVHRDGREYQLSSLYDNEKILDRWAEFVNFRLYEAIIYLFGLGTGMYVRRLFEESEKRNGKEIQIMVYEPDTEVFGELIRYYDISDIISDERVTLLIGELDKEKLLKWTTKRINYNNIYSTGLAYHLNYPRIFPEEREKYDKEIEDQLGEYYGNLGFKKSYSKYLYENVLENIERMTETLSLDSLMNSIPENVPVFIVSSGPSLSKNISELKRAKGKGIIIAADSALGVFDRFGIVPDMYATIDPEKQKENFEYDWVPDVPALLEMTSPKHVVRDGQKYFMICTYDRFTSRFLCEKSKGTPYHVLLTGGGCQASYAFSLGVNMGAKTVIFVGQDLAYTGDQAHAAEVAVEDDEMLSTLEIMDINGNPVKANRQFIGYRRWFERAIAQCDGLEAVDATEGGARIEGTKIMTLREAIDRYCVEEWDVNGFFSRCERLLSDEDRNEYFKRLKKVPGLMDEILSDGRKLVRDYEKMEGLVRSGKVTADKLKKLISVTKKLSDRIEENEAYSYITMVNSASEFNVEQTVNNVDPDLEKDLINMCTLGREHTENIIKAAEKVKKDFSGLKLETN